MMKRMMKNRTDTCKICFFVKKTKKLLILNEKYYIINEYANGIYLPLITKGVIV